MSQQIPFSSAVRVGVVTGAIVLGILGRAGTAMLAMASGRAANLSARGLLETAVLGGLVGAMGGLLLALLKRKSRLPDPVPGAIIGVVLFAGMLVMAWTGGRINWNSMRQFPATFAVVGALCLLYGLITNSLLNRSRPD